MSMIAEIDAPLGRPATPAQIEQLEARLLHLEQVNIPIVERFAPGMYSREANIPKDTFAIGQEHRTTHFNIVPHGRLTAIIDGKTREIVGPCAFVSGPGRKVVYAHEATRIINIHFTDETDPARLEDALIIKSAAYLEHHAALELQKLRALVADSEQSKKEETK